MSWREDIDAALASFTTGAQLAGDAIAPEDIVVEFQDAPHRQPTRLPPRRMAVYGFWGEGCWLKVGKVGPNSTARYTSQHYTGSALSTLAGSLIGDENMRQVAGFNPAACGDWIRGSTHESISCCRPIGVVRYSLCLKHFSTCD